MCLSDSNAVIRSIPDGHSKREADAHPFPHSDMRDTALPIGVPTPHGSAISCGESIAQKPLTR